MKDRAVLKEILIQLDKEQLDQVRLGMKNGVDTDVYLNPAYMPLQMQWIRIGLEKGHGVFQDCSSVCCL